MARKRINHRRRARRAWAHLVKAARRRKQLTYAEIAGKIGLHHRAAQWFLGVIQRYCASAGLPPLQALVVNQRTGVPGAGYVATPRGGMAYDRIVTKVYNHSWPLSAPF